MADMIEDVQVKEAWVKAHTITGITVGKALILQNKGPFDTLIFVGATQPEATSKKGFRMVNSREWISSVGDVVWVRAENGQSSMCIQGA